MPGEVDSRLMDVLQGSMSLADALRDLGSTGEITVRLGREDGLLLLELVTGSRDPEAEAWSQRGRLSRSCMHSLKVAGLIFEWPPEELATKLAGDLAGAANDNAAAPVRVGLRSDGESPALR
jgi:hypothetical protein